MHTGLSLASILSVALALVGCSVFPAAEEVPTHTYRWEVDLGSANQRHDDGPTIVVERPEARAGYDSPRMAYVEQPYGLSYFAHNRWVDAPPRLLAPLLVDALEATGRFDAVTQAPTAVDADARLETEILHLYQDFTKQPSEVVVGVRVRVVDHQGRHVLAETRLQRTQRAPADDPYGGVVATNRALGHLLPQVADFCADTLKGRVERQGRRGK